MKKKKANAQTSFGLFRESKRYPIVMNLREFSLSRHCGRAAMPLNLECVSHCRFDCERMNLLKKKRNNNDDDDIIMIFIVAAIHGAKTI